jgi:catechol 2,3-dioxygenase-like lactoylglutathione lyase family enzyme
MLDHVGIEVSGLARSKAFYKAALEPLGIRLLMEFEGATGFGKDTEHGPKPSSGSTSGDARPSVALTSPSAPGPLSSSMLSTWPLSPLGAPTTAPPG